MHTISPGTADPVTVKVLRLPDYVGEYYRRRERARDGAAGPEVDFGQPSDYGLDQVTLARHIRQLRRAGWQGWEIRARFDFGSVTDAA